MLRNAKLLKKVTIQYLINQYTLNHYCFSNKILHENQHFQNQSNPFITNNFQYFIIIPAMEPITTNSYLDEFKIIKTLGFGFHAKVKLAEKEGNLYAIKRYKKETADLSTLQHQLNILKELHHPNIVKLFGVREQATYKKKNGCQYKCLAIILQYIDGGQLFQYVAQCGKFSPNVSRTYFIMLLDALEYIHSRGISHRDIKPQNILLNQDFNLKVTDFGFSTYLSRGELRTKLGTEAYMAPEIRTRKYNGKEVDLFAAGVILFILYSGSPPFEKATPTDPYYKVLMDKKHSVFWNGHSRRRLEGFYTDQFKDLINRMLAQKPDQRYNLSEIRNHPWVTQDIVTLNSIYQEFTFRKKTIQKAQQKKRELKLKKKLMTEELQQNTSRSNSQFQDYNQLIQKINFNSGLLKVSDTVEKQDLVVNESAKKFIGSLKYLLQKKECNLLIDDQQLQQFIVSVDSQNPQVTIDLNHTVLGENHNLSLTCKLSKTNDGFLRVKFLIDEVNSGNIRFYNLVELIKDEFAHLSK